MYIIERNQSYHPCGSLFSLLLLQTFLLMFSGCGGTLEKAEPVSLSDTPIRDYAVSGSQVSLTWTDRSSNELGFEIERKEGSEGAYHPIGTVGENLNEYTDAHLRAGITYFYRVRAYNADGYSAYSNEIRVKISGY